MAYWALWALLAGFGAELQPPKLNLMHYSFEIRDQVATILIILLRINWTNLKFSADKTCVFMFCLGIAVGGLGPLFLLVYATGIMQLSWPYVTRPHRWHRASETAALLSRPVSSDWPQPLSRAAAACSDGRCSNTTEQVLQVALDRTKQCTNRFTLVSKKVVHGSSWYRPSRQRKTEGGRLIHDHTAQRRCYIKMCPAWKSAGEKIITESICLQLIKIMPAP